ncbi:MAG: ATP-dependent RecD-like DNA helicase [Flavobacteriales bacterium]
MTKNNLKLTAPEQQIYSKLLSNLGFPPTEDQNWLFVVLSKFFLSTKPNCSLILSGYAGTGKTTCINAIVKSAEKLSLKPILLAPTGRAAKVMSKYTKTPAHTIHKHIYKKSTVNGKVSFFPTENKIKNALFIVDEASMISAENSMGTNILDDLVEHIFSVESAKLIIVGDEAQLPPVHSVKSPALDLSYMKDHYHITAFQVRLREVVRQGSESGILKEATMLRGLLEQPNPELPRFTAHEDFKIIDFNEFQDHLESSISSNGIENTLVITRSNLMANRFNQQIRTTSLWMEEEISVGDLIMVTKNNYYWPDKNRSALNFIANGDVAEVKDIKREEKLHGYRFATLRITLPDQEHILPLDVKANLDSIHVNAPSLTSAETNRLYNDLLAEYSDERSPKHKVMQDPYFNALQLKFAYAITCHKSQGGQWNTVFIDGGGMTNMESTIEIIRWLYTAITRGVKQVYLVNFSEDFLA